MRRNKFRQAWIIEVALRGKNVGWQATGADWYLTRKAARQHVAVELNHPSYDRYQYRVRKYVPEKA